MRQRRTDKRAEKQTTEAAAQPKTARERAEAAVGASAANTKAKPDDSSAFTGEVPERKAPRERRPSTSTTRVSKLEMTGFESIVESLFEFDPDQAYKEVVDYLTLSQKASRTEYAQMLDALDEASENVRRSLQLLANAKVALVSYKADVKVIESELHEQATQEIMRKFEDPDDKDVTKKPTIADVEAYKVATYHDEYADCQTRLAKASETVHYLEGLHKVCSERNRDLRQMLAGARG